MNITNNSTGVKYILYHYFLYNYSLPDIIINYSLIILYTILNNYYKEDFRRFLSNLHSLTFFVLQVLCWMALDAYGVSLVWSGQLGLTVLLLLDWVSYHLPLIPPLTSLSLLLTGEKQSK